MTDIDAFIESYEHHRKGLKNANKLNKAAVFDALAAAGIASVTVEFDGEGDSGQIGEINARAAGDLPASLPKTPVTLHRASWRSDTLSTTEQTLAEAVETLSYEYLEQEQGGWENNDGAYGFFEFDVAKRAIHLEFNGRYTDVATHDYEF